MQQDVMQADQAEGCFPSEAYAKRPKRLTDDRRRSHARLLLFRRKHCDASRASCLKIRCLHCGEDINKQQAKLDYLFGYFLSNMAFLFTLFAF